VAFASGPENPPGPLFPAGRESASDDVSPTKPPGLVGTEKPVEAGALVASTVASVSSHGGNSIVNPRMTKHRLRLVRQLVVRDHIVSSTVIQALAELEQ
jgi:hypothetical protein